MTDTKNSMAREYTSKMKKYPTKEEILDPPVVYKMSTIATIKDWKEIFFQNWKAKTAEEKLTALENLVKMLSKTYEIEVNVDKSRDLYSYEDWTNTITIDKDNPSIISTLHEFRHRLNGPSEISACRWSIQLFAKCFPKAFEQLEFKEGTHLLVKK